MSIFVRWRGIPGNCVSKEVDDDYEVNGGITGHSGWCRKERGHKMWQFVDEIRKREAAKRGSANA